MNLLVEVAGKTDVGCVRANNEDNFGYDSRHGIYVVCDGMGGAAAGEVASKIAVDTVLANFRNDPGRAESERPGSVPHALPAPHRRADRSVRRHRGSDQITFGERG